MADHQFESRREVLTTVTGLALTFISPAAYSDEVIPNGEASGKPNDFHFLHGEWKIRNRRLSSRDTDMWDEFDGEATCWSILSGIASIEELRIPSRSFFGMGLRILDVEKRVWNDFWINARSGILTPPGQTGVFTMEWVRLRRTIGTEKSRSRSAVYGTKSPPSPAAGHRRFRMIRDSRGKKTGS